MSDPRAHPDTTRVVGLALLAFVLMLTYDIARPAVESLFLNAHKADGLPAAWLLVALGVLLCVAIYNRFVARVRLLHLFGATSAISALLLVGLLVGRSFELPGVHYLLYVWKDIYIILLVEIFYSFCNAVYPIKTARRLYGMFGVVGNLGGITGNVSLSWYTHRYGSHGATATMRSLWVVPVLLGLKWLFCYPFARRAGATIAPDQVPRSSGFIEAIRVLHGSSYLVLLLLLIALVQIVINLVDYSYNSLLSSIYPIADARTAIHSGVYALVQTTTIALNALAGPLLRTLGIPIVLETVPLLLGGIVGFYVLRPSLYTAVVAKVASKCLDYSLFRIAKENLYIPLTYAEKTLGKSLVDMFMYRVAKALTALLLMVLAGASKSAFIEPAALLFIAAWLVVTIVIVKRFRLKVSRSEEMAGA